MDDIEIWCPECNSVVPIEEHFCSSLNDDNNTGNNSNNNDNKNDYSEMLIAAVFQKEALWNSRLPYKFRGASEIKALWSEVDDCLGTSSGTSQAKWKNLRDRFVKEHTIQCTYIPSDSAAVKKKSTWPLYDSLRFLLPTINYRKTKSNIENEHPNKSLSVEQRIEFNCSSASGVNNEKENNTLQQSPDSKMTQTLRKVCGKLEHAFAAKLRQAKPNSANVNIIKEEVCGSKHNNKRSIPDASDVSDAPESSQLPKRIRKSKPVPNIEDTSFEKAILRELEQTRPINEIDVKPDKIVSFTKYLDVSLRGMTPNTSKRIMNDILKLIIEEDI